MTLQVRETVKARQSAETLATQVGGLEDDLRTEQEALQASQAECKSCAATPSWLPCLLAGLCFTIFSQVQASIGMLLHCFGADSCPACVTW